MKRKKHSSIEFLCRRKSDRKAELKLTFNKIFCLSFFFFFCSRIGCSLDFAGLSLIQRTAIMHPYKSQKNHLLSFYNCWKFSIFYVIYLTDLLSCLSKVDEEKSFCYLAMSLVILWPESPCWNHRQTVHAYLFGIELFCWHFLQFFVYQGLKCATFIVKFEKLAQKISLE